MNVCESNVVGLTGQFSPALFEYNVFWKAWRVMREQRVSAKLRREPVLGETQIKPVFQSGNSNTQ
jgi:hypothetical protein